MADTRSSWAEYFLTIAHAVATRSTCDRKHVGCVLVLEKRIVATGFNGSIPGMAHCDDVGHDMQDNHCVRTTHAEANAIVQAARFGIPIAGARVYVNAFPCWQCFKLLAAANVSAIVYDDSYRVDPRVLQAAEATGVQLVCIPPRA